MTEKKMQFELAKWFSQEYPQFRGLLFEVNNNTMNVKHGANRLAMGMVAGVADLVFISPNSGRVAGIELKAEGSVHKTDHIENQINWGLKIMKNGGFYLISADLKLIKIFMRFLISGEFEGAEVIQNHCISAISLEKKTVKF